MRGIYHVTFVLFCFSVLLVLDKGIRPKIANFAVVTKSESHSGSWADAADKIGNHTKIEYET